ncbi:MAG: alanine racemase [Thermoanaerobaculales bacterium]|jgi:D-serine deaminase-like pyridoxal phosphate-dependent protein|nr:alanine racemase [Thermoanaerobaculales bacterium]
MKIDELPTPCALVDLDRLEANAERMAERAHELGVRLRPHVKTHKCVEAARIQTRGHFGGITVSTLAEARGFVEAGFTDLTYAVPVAPQRLAEVVELGARVERLAVLVDHLDTVRAIEEVGRTHSVVLPVWLKLDCGLHRSGVDPEAEASVVLAQRLAASPQIDFRGVLTHAGQSYRATGREEAAVVARDECRVSRAFVNRLAEDGIAVPEVSIGSTPTMTSADDLAGVDEIRPGNYLFFDAFQAAIGSCGLEDVAFSVLATVVSAFPERQRAVVDAGALALSKDPGPTHVDPACGFGRPVATEDQHPLPGLRLTSLSQEHGVVEGPGTAALRPGTRLRILPNHSCLAAAGFDRYRVVRGLEVVDVWRPIRGW